MDDASFASLALRLVLSLGVVLALMLGAAAVVKRKGLGRGFGGGKHAAMEVLARQPLSRNASLAVVRVGDRALIVGVTEQSVTLIDEADGEAFLPAPAVTPGDARTALPSGGEDDRSGPTWTALVDALREKTVRRS